MKQYPVCDSIGICNVHADPMTDKVIDYFSQVVGKRPDYDTRKPHTRLLGPDKYDVRHLQENIARQFVAFGGLDYYGWAKAKLKKIDWDYVCYQFEFV